MDSVRRYTIILYDNTKPIDLILNSGYSNSAFHTISISSVLFPVYYNQFFNTIIMRATGNIMIYYKLNKPVIDSIYLETQLKS